jgi:hypothetical protein
MANNLDMRLGPGNMPRPTRAAPGGSDDWSQVIVGVDGTGAQDWGAVDIRRSFVNKVVAQSTIRHKLYLRGPDGAGAISHAIAGKAKAWLEKAIALGTKSVVFTGYSRGGVIGIDVCYWLKKNHPDVGVHCMALFDAVDRQAFMGGDIPSNVKWCYHAMRDRSTGSRPYMKNCATQKEDNTHLEIQTFYASHGGMGGMPWDAASEERFKASDLRLNPFQSDGFLKNQNLIAGVIAPWRMFDTLAGCKVTLAQDEAGSAAVGKWMWDRLIRRGILAASANPSSFAPMPEDASRSSMYDYVR